MRPFAALLALAALIPLAGCGEGGLATGLRQVGIGTATPDEFMVLPTRPLELPPDLAALPPPTPGARNRVAYAPQADAMTALAGRPPAAGAPASALVARVGGADPGIRATLATEDVVWRREHQPRPFERWFRPDSGSTLVYEDMRLDSEAELARLRARGVRVPAAPPLAEE